MEKKELNPEHVGNVLLEKLSGMGYVEKENGKYYINEKGIGMLSMIGITEKELYE